MNPINLPYQIEIRTHQRKFPDHNQFKIYGTNQRENLRFLYCLTCKKPASPIKVLYLK